MRDELWIKHDARSRQDGKMRWFIRRTGQQGYGAFWSTLEILHYQRDHSISISGPEFEGIADDLLMEPEQYLEILKIAVAAGLFRMGDGRLWQERLMQDQADRSRTKQRAGALGGMKSGEVRREKLRSKIEAEQANLLKEGETTKQNEASNRSNEATKLEEREERDRSNTNTTPLPPEGGIEAEPKKRVRKKSPGGPLTVAEVLALELPPNWGPNARGALQQWAEFRALKKNPMLRVSWVSEIRTYANEPRRFVDAVEFSVRKGYKGLVDDPEKTKINGHANGLKTKAEREFENTMNVLGEFVHGEK